MRNFWKSLLAMIAVAIAMVATPAAAQATRTWVSGVGDDANPCSRTAPCKTFAGAISKTAAGGEINVLDPGGFGALTITKSITIRSDSIEAGVLVSGTNGFIINAATTDTVVIDGIDFEGLGTGLNGIKVLQARNVVVRNSVIRNFREAATGSGISLENAGIATRLTVDNVTFINNLYGVRQTSALGSKAVINNSLFAFNATAGISATGSANTLQINGNAFYNSTKAIELLGGATGTSFGNNAIGTAATDPVTITPLG